MDHNDPDELIVVRRVTRRHIADQYALVLAAMGIPSTLASESGLVAIGVARRDVDRALSELASYDHENPARPALPEASAARSAPVELAMVYCTVLLFFFAAARHTAFSIDWLGAGALQSALVAKGELWRAVTALCLHVESPHLLGNLVFGSAFLLLLAQLVGAGVAAFSTVLTGALGNLVSALLQTPDHTSIGASTAIFGSVGILAAIRQSRTYRSARFHPRAWTPLAGGLALLAFLGFSGENTDMLAHATGFGSGLLVGFLLARWGVDWTRSPSRQWICAGAAGVTLLLSWLAAILA
jgi:membrane associated rhomboid family serine protease